MERYLAQTVATVESKPSKKGPLLLQPRKNDIDYHAGNSDHGTSTGNTCCINSNILYMNSINRTTRTLGDTTVDPMSCLFQVDSTI